MEVLSKLEHKVFRLMDEKLSRDLVYHNKEHTRRVMEAVQWLCEAENTAQPDRFLLSTAALFHDIGFIETYDGHEAESCRIARRMLAHSKFPKEKISVVCDLILATKIPQNPTNDLQKIICDADLDYLGTEDFYDIGALLRQELIFHGKLAEDKNSWIRYQIRFLDTHHYFTETSSRLREPVKKDFLRQLKSAVSH